MLIWDNGPIVESIITYQYGVWCVEQIHGTVGDGLLKVGHCGSVKGILSLAVRCQTVCIAM